ncbi:Glycoside hydrolase family 61 protein I [Mycena indigotica]|uniref:AA9 family lytic polysaccharide monooxygenase n=1 Tax=Mycena indigotica TaxID=2126181 RepID=A0A8H6T3J9_9AGAR|nr:Glycoside hydrolase family 61 protein I [Mycena indigotica]KAF7310249.1 Glycoside hydrolase family 61 protein I [Mycena indigotica]
MLISLTPIRSLPFSRRSPPPHAVRGTSAAAFSPDADPGCAKSVFAAFLWKNSVIKLAFERPPSKHETLSPQSCVIYPRMKLHASFLALAASAAVARGHTIFQQAYVNGVSQGHLTGIRVPDYDGPITDVTSNDIICNGGINPYHTPLPSTVITVPAGAQFTAEWHHSLVGADPSDSADPVDPSHHGPTITYLYVLRFTVFLLLMPPSAQIPNALQSTVTGLKWFKIQEDGLIASNQTWGVDRMIANKGKVTFTIPPCIPAGQYLLRHEMIALHGATAYPGAQFYVSAIALLHPSSVLPLFQMECAQLSITGGGSTQPATVSFPGAYKASTLILHRALAYPELLRIGHRPRHHHQHLLPVAHELHRPRPAGVHVLRQRGRGDDGAGVVLVDGEARELVHGEEQLDGEELELGAGDDGRDGRATLLTARDNSGSGYTGATACVSPYKCTFVNDYYSQCL